MPSNPTPRAPRAARSNEALLREVLAGQAAQGAQLQELAARLNAVSQDARQARDESNRIATVLEQQDIVAKFDEYRRNAREDLAALRVDVVQANTLLKKDLAAESEARLGLGVELDKRLGSLEAARDRVVGVAAFFAWLAKVAPWLLAGIAAFAAGAAHKDKLP